MANITVSKKDIIWSYVAQFFNIGSGLIILPLVLKLLSTDEIAINYLMLTISTMVTLIDFGFSPQFGRNISYVFAGVHTLKKEGIEHAQGDISYRLLNNMIGVARRLYGLMGIVALVLMLTFGSWYVYDVTKGFTLINNMLLIWVLFSISVSFNIYYSYYNILLSGRGQIKESKKALLTNKLSYLVLSFLLLYLGFGLLGIVIANLISPFIGRYLSKIYFYDKDIIKRLAAEKGSREEENNLFWVLWHNSKKMGLVAVSAYGINKASMFFAGLYMVSSDVASYGLMIQLVTIIASVAGSIFVSYQPTLVASFSEHNYKKFKYDFSFSIMIFYILFFMGVIVMLILGPWLLQYIKSNAMLPSLFVVALYAIVVFFEQNTSFYATILVNDNRVPFVTASIVTGLAICIISFVGLKYFSFGILELVCTQLICSLVYSTWKWVYEACNLIDTTYPAMVKEGVFIVASKIKNYVGGKI